MADSLAKNLNRKLNRRLGLTAFMLFLSNEQAKKDFKISS
jgi:hypothetical protein